MKNNILSFLGIFVSCWTMAQHADYSETLPELGAQGCAHCQRYKQRPIGIEPLSAANIDNNDRSDTIDVLHYTVRLDVTDFSNQTIQGDCAVRFSPKLNNITSIQLDLLELEVDSVQWNGQTVSNYLYNDTLLQVPFPIPMNDTDTAEVRVYYHGYPVQDASWGGFYFQSGYAYNIGVGFSSNPHTIGRYWHPCFDNFAERATYTFLITSSNTKRAHCNGYLVSETSTGNTIERTWEMPSPIPSYLACVAVANYATVHQTHNGTAGTIPIELVALPADTNNMKNSFQHLGTAIDAFEYWYGDYAWNKVGYTVVPFAAGAMEHATMISYPKFAITGNLTYETLVAHELCHSWWGDWATCETAEDMWINEGMASYGEHLFMERQYGWDSYINTVKTNHYNVMRNAHIAEGGYLAISGVPHQYTYGEHVYNKGASVAHNLRWYLGDALYRQGMRAVLANHAFQNLNSYQLRDELTANTGIDMTAFFDDWVFAGGFSHFEPERMVVTPAPLPDYTAKVYIQQKGLGTTHFHTDVPLQLTFRDDQWNVFTTRVSVSGEYDSVTVQLPFEPSVVIINEQHRLNQAREDKQKMLYQTGNHSFIPNFAVQALTDSAFMHFEHHLVAPDPSSQPAYTLSTRHYWTVTGVFPDTFHATLRFNVDNTMDSDLLAVYGADSMKLLYRPAPDAPWQEHPAYNKVQFLTLSYFNVTNLLPGDYAFGNYFPSLTGVTPVQAMIEKTLELFPNPNTGQFCLRWETPTPADWVITVYDGLGQQVHTQYYTASSAATQQVPVHLPAALPNGSYWLRLQDVNGTYRRVLPLVITH